MNDKTALSDKKALSGKTALSDKKAALSNKKAVSDSQLICHIEQFYYREARLLDNRQYQQWLGLLTEDIDYRIPSRHIATPDPKLRDTEAFHSLEHEIDRGGPYGSPLRVENYFTLAIRVDRAYKVNAWADNPPARTRRYISNVEVFEVDDGYHTYNNFQLIYSRHDNANFTYTGQRCDTLREVDGELKIASREIIHDWNVIAVPTMGLLF